MLTAASLKKLCPCGSGRKARYCCSRTEATEHKNQLLSQQSLAARKKLTRLLRNFCAEVDISCSIQEAWLFFSGDSEDDPPPEIMPIFMPWFIYRWDCRPDDVNEGEPNPRHSLAAMYVRRRGHELDKIARECIEAALKTPMSFYKVMDAVPGKNVTVKDLLREDDYPEIVLNDISLSHSSRAGAIFMGLIFDVHYVAMAEGAAPLMIPPECTPEILELADEIKDELGALTDESLMEWEMEIFDLYWTFYQRAHANPVITNTSGEIIKIQTLYYDCPDQKTAVKLLAPLARAPELIEETLEQIAKNEVPDVVSFKWLSSKPSKKLQGPVVYGDISVAKDSFTVSVNSDERAERIKKEISKRLGSLAKFRVKSYANPFPSAADQTKNNHQKPTKASQKNLAEIPPELEKSLAELAASHKKKWFDSPIPMLSGKTPREASKTDKGRKELEVLIETYNFRRADRADNPMLTLFNPTEEEIRSELGL